MDNTYKTLTKEKVFAAAKSDNSKYQFDIRHLLLSLLLSHRRHRYQLHRYHRYQLGLARTPLGPSERVQLFIFMRVGIACVRSIC
jgi:hypothetical protein